MNYIIKPRASRKIFTFYQNVAKKYRHTYDKDDMKRNAHDAIFSMYQIERSLLPRFSYALPQTRLGQTSKHDGARCFLGSSLCKWSVLRWKY